MIQLGVPVAVIKKTPPFLLIFVLIGSLTEKVMAASSHIAYKYFNYGDSLKTNVGEHLVLFTTDLTAASSLSLRYGLDGVTSPSLTAMSPVQPITTNASSRSDNTKHRNSGGVSYTNHYTETFQGTTGFDFSTKPDFTSYTIGQAFNTPVLDDLTTIGLAAYFTGNKIKPLIVSPDSATTPDYSLRFPSGELENSQMNALISVERILGATSKIKLLLETFSSNGYLSAGYQRVPISAGTSSNMALESLPNYRNGTAITAIFSQGLTERSAIHFRLRSYSDTYGITAYSGDTRFKAYLNDYLTYDLSYRYYNQTAATFWGSSFATKPAGSFTNQPALSGFGASQYGMGFRYELIPGITNRFNFSGTLSANLDYYVRSDSFSFTTLSAGYETDF